MSEETIKQKLQKYFEENVLHGTGFTSLEEVKEDKTDPDADPVRALLAIEARGTWRGMLLAAALLTNKI